ncbi:MAG: hypothetical protein KA142_02325 [Chromatiaceae bacterium]|nr:hypothetical protein [Chromatiaceae bacterium]
MTRAGTLTIQRQLNAAGWRLREDGIYGPATARAYQAWLNAHTPESMPTPAPVAAKPWYLSRAILGLLASAAATLAGQAGWMVNADEITALLVQLVEVGGLVLAFIGTVRRRAPIDPTLAAPGLRFPTRAPDLPAGGHPHQPPGPFGY